MKKYLYLEKHEFVKTWVDGGTIPIPLASKFRSDARNGTQTVDENRYHRSEVNLFQLPGFKIHPDATMVSLNIIGATYNGHAIPDLIDANLGTEDGLVICLANSLDRTIAERLGKRACVEIENVAALKDHLDNELGTDGIMGACEYTDGHERDTFLKSCADKWQDEFRVYWPITINNALVTIPSGFAKEVIFDPPLVPMKIEKLPDREPVAEFGAYELESIKSLIIGYIRRTISRPVSKNELCNLVCDTLHINYDRTCRVLRVMTNNGLTREVPCSIHSDHVECGDSAVNWKPRVQTAIPDPNDRTQNYWELPLTRRHKDSCPFLHSQAARVAWKLAIDHVLRNK